MQKNDELFLPRRLKELRGNKTQAETAKNLQVNQQTYARWELGDRQPKLQDLSMLALHFGVSLDWLLGLTENREAGQTPLETGKLTDMINVLPVTDSVQARRDGGVCSDCARKDAEIERLNRIVDNLSTALAKK